MAPRLNKRQLRELEELQALDIEAATDVQQVTSEQESSPPPKTMSGGFAAVSTRTLVCTALF